MSRQFLHKGLAEQDMEFGSIKLTKKGWEVLKGDLAVWGQLEPVQAVEALFARPQRNADLSFNAQLFQLLREKRKELADAAGVPPYVIFADKTLVEMATFFPQSRKKLLDMHGVGSVKCEKFGASFTLVIKQFCREHSLPERPKNPYQDSSVHLKKGQSGKSSKPRHIHVGDIFNSGRTIQEIMDIFNIKQTTVIDHLNKYLLQGYALRCGELFYLSKLPQDQKNIVLKAFDKCGSEYLKPAYDALDGAVSYGDLKILRLYYLANKAAENKAKT